MAPPTAVLETETDILLSSFPSLGETSEKFFNLSGPDGDIVKGREERNRRRGDRQYIVPAKAE